MRVVIDANVAIAAVACRGLCDAVMEFCMEQHEPIWCEEILAEIKGKLTEKLKVPQPVVSDYLKILRSSGEVLRPLKVSAAECRDPNDLAVLGVAASSKADMIITGDKDLLVLERFQGTQILTPRSFWEFCHNQKT